MADAAKEKEPIKSVQTYGRKKTATAVAYCKRGKGILNVNGKPLEQVRPDSGATLRKATKSLYRGKDTKKARV